MEKLIKDIGLVNAPFFLQGFVDGETVRFYDPGLRLPGGEYERMFESAVGKNVFYPLIEYALTGMVSSDVELETKDIITASGDVTVKEVSNTEADYFISFSKLFGKQ